MNHFYLLALLLGNPPLLRISYDVELVIEDRLVHLKMVLNKLDDQHFSISSRKAVSGSIFTYWATAGHDVLLFPKSKQAFSGAAGKAFALFPEGPRLTRVQWLGLLEQGPPEKLGSFSYGESDGWKTIASEAEGVRIRWQERNRKTKTKYRDVVFVPHIPEYIKISPLEDMVLYWQTNAID